MTINIFLQKLRGLNQQWTRKIGLGWRNTDGDCPIMAVARDEEVGQIPWSNAHATLYARKMGLSRSVRSGIIRAADHPDKEDMLSIVLNQKHAQEPAHAEC